MPFARKPAFILLILVAIQASSLIGQNQTKVASPGTSQSPTTTEDSPRWWTLTDEITPQELRAIHEDIELHKERYREAVQAGTETSRSRLCPWSKKLSDQPIGNDFGRICSEYRPRTCSLSAMPKRKGTRNEDQH